MEKIDQFTRKERPPSEEGRVDEAAEKFGQTENGEPTPPPAPDLMGGGQTEWEKELEENKKEREQEKELDKLVKKLEKDKEERKYVKKKFKK